MKSFIKKTKVEYNDVYYYFKEILKPKLIELYELNDINPIFEKIKTDLYLNKQYEISGITKYHIVYNINPIIFIFGTYTFTIYIELNYISYYIIFKEK
jgi:hypothetical protein